jgi:antirestriction protein ArdC
LSGCGGSLFDGWLQHASRLNREGITKAEKFGSSNYSKEELIAEMGAAFFCAHTGIDVQPVSENNAAYLQGWLTVLKADKKLIFKAAAAAQKAVDYILNKNREN